MPTGWKRLAAFYALTFLLLIIIPVILNVTASGPMDFATAGARASEKTSLTWTSNLLVVIRLSRAEPVLWLIVFGAAVPSLAALLACTGRGSQVRALLARFRIRTPWRDALLEYVCRQRRSQPWISAATRT